MKFSVAMCTYNGERFLPEQLASLAAQTRLPDELVVSDDRSMDATTELIKEFAASAPFPVRLVSNEWNLGSTKNFERAIALCEGDIVALCDQDDVWLPQKLRLTEEVFEERPEVGAVFTDLEIVDEWLQPVSKRMWEAVKFDVEKQRMVSDGRAFELFSAGNFATGATLAFRSFYRDLFLPIPRDTTYIHDGWIALLIAAVAPLVFIPQTTVLYRQHQGQQVGANLEALDAGAGKRGAGRLLDAAQRQPSFAESIRALRLACEWLEARPTSSGAVISQVKPRLTHFETRAAMPEIPRLARVPRVLRELLTLRYYRYSRGLRSAVKDLWL